MIIIPKIDPEFKSLMRKLTKQESRQLRENIIADGVCREPIVLWKGTGLILDGHNRFGICKEHGIEYEIIEIEFEDREAAKQWIRTNQLGRRNLSKPNAVKLSNLRKEIEETRAKARMSQGGKKSPLRVFIDAEPLEDFGQQGVTKPNNPLGDPGRTRKKIADGAGIGQGTVQRYNEIVSEGNSRLIELVDDGEITIGAAHRMLVKEFLRDLKKIDECIKYAAEHLPFPNDKESNKKAADGLEWLAGKIRYLHTYVSSLSMLKY